MAQLYRDKEGDQDKRGRALQRGARPQPARTSRRSSASTRSSRRRRTGRRSSARSARCCGACRRRTSSNPDLEFNLWHNLGLIYRDRLKDTTSAIEAFKMATRFKPDEAVERQILAELYEATDQTEAADRRARARPAEGPAARRPVPEPLQALPADARVRPRVVHVRGARVPAQGRRRGAALLRGLPPARDDPGEEPPRQRAVGQEPLPQGREPLHRQDLRDAHARGDRREDQPAPARRSSCRCSTGASSRTRRRAR